MWLVQRLAVRHPFPVYFEAVSHLNKGLSVGPVWLTSLGMDKAGKCSRIPCSCLQSTLNTDAASYPYAIYLCPGDLNLDRSAILYLAVPQEEWQSFKFQVIALLLNFMPQSSREWESIKLSVRKLDRTQVMLCYENFIYTKDVKYRSCWVTALCQ